MSIQLFTNNPSSLLASGITNVSSTLALTPGTGTLFPSPGAGQIAVVTVEDVSGNIEIMWCTSRSADSLTVTRAQEGTTALTFASGSRVELRVTAGTLAGFLQKGGGDTLSGTTNLGGILALGGGGSIQGGEFTGYHRSAPGVTTGQIAVVAGQPYSGANLILTAGNVTTGLPAGTSLCYTNMIVMWYGSSGSIPTGWLLCNGANGTPNLTDKFVIGAGGAQAPSFGNTGGTLTPSLSGGTISGTVDPHTLTIAEMPAHGHNYWGPAGASSVASGSGHGWDWGVAASSQTNTPAGSADNGAHAFIQNQGGGTGHSHTLTGATVGGSMASGAALPPFVGLFFIMKS
jgi:hypothetical protein